MTLAAALGGYHHFRIRPQLREGGGDATERHLRGSVAVETVLLVVVGVASAVLVTASMV